MKLTKKDFLVVGVTIAAIATIYRVSSAKQMLTGDKKILGIF